MLISSKLVRQFTLFFLVGLLPAANLVAQQPSAGKVAKAFQRSNYTIPFKQFVLKNGLTLLVNEDHSVPVVSVNMWYHVGSKNERRGRTGFAHLFEHFFFNGSENYPHGFREAMDNVGANNRNGTTNNDRTNFFEDVPVSALERTLYLEADRMGFLALSKEMLERERGVVQNEKRQGENQPLGKAWTQMPAKLYPYEHPYSWTVIGSMDDLNAASLDDVKEWYQGYYGPNNAVIALSGDIQPDSALRLVSKYFEGIAPVSPVSRLESWVPRLSNNVRDQMEDRVPETVLFRVFHVPEWKSKELEYLRLFADVLGGSSSSRLYRKLVLEKEVATQANAWIEDQELSGLLYIEVDVKHGVDPHAAEAAMDSVVNQLVKTGPTDEETARASSRYLASFSRGLERTGGMGGRSDVLAASMVYGNSPTMYLDKLELIAKASKNDITAMGKKWLAYPSYLLQVNPFPNVAAAKTSVDRSVLPALANQPAAVFPVVQRATLKNGLKIMLLERNTAPIVNLTLAVDAGLSSDEPARAGVASLALDLLAKGTTRRDVFAIARELDLAGAELNTRNDLDLSFVQLKALSQNLPASLDIFSDVVLNPAFPEDQFKILKEQRLSQIDFEKTDPNEIVSRILPALIYGKNHAYGMPGSGTGYSTSVQTILRKDLAQWHRSWFSPTNSTLIVTGNINMQKLLPALEQAFGAWKPITAPTRDIAAVPATTGGKIYVVDKPDATQSVIVAAHVASKGGQDNEPAIETFMRNFGGMSTSRLNRNLRLDKHWSYGSVAYLLPAKGQRRLTIIAPVQTDKTKEAMSEVAKEIKDVAGNRPLVGEEYESIMRNMKLRMPARFSTLQSLENAAASMINYNLPDDYWQTYPAKLGSLTEQQLNDAAASLVHPGEMIWLIVGDLKKVGAGIKELNFGDVIQLDADGNLVE